MGKNSLYGTPNGLFNDYSADAVRAQRAPVSSDVGYQTGQQWVNEAAGDIYALAAISAGAATWNLLGTTGGPLNTLTADSGGAISPASNNINLAGTANQVTTAGAGSTITFSLPAAVTVPGSLTTTTSLAVGTSATVGTTLGVTGLTTLAALTQVGTANINASGAAVTTIGSVTGASGLVERVGTGNFSLDGVTNSTYAVGASTTTGTITIGGTAQTGAITLGSSSGTNSVAIGAGAGATTVNVANGVTGNTVSIANGINTSAQTVNIAGGASAANSTVSILNGAGSAGTQTCNVLGAGATRAGALNLGTGAAAHAVAIGNVAGTLAIAAPTVHTLASGAGTALTVTTAAGTGVPVILTSPAVTTDALQITVGGIKVPVSANAAGASPQTVSARFGQAIFTDVIANGAYGTLTITNSMVSSSSIMLMSPSCSTVNSALSVVGIVPGSGSVAVRLFNGGASSTAANILVNFWLLN